MSQTTPIEWCDSAVNPVMGCDGCELAIPGREGNTCYTWYLHTRMHREGQKGYADKFFEPKMFAGRVAKAALWSDLTGTERASKPWLSGLPRTIFVSDMGDALSQSVGFSFLKTEIIDNVSSTAGSRHRWLWLTKRPQRMAFFDRWLESEGLAWPENLWALTSVTSQRFAHRALDLLKVRAAVRGLSCEPLRGPVRLIDVRIGKDRATCRERYDVLRGCDRREHLRADGTWNHRRLTDAPDSIAPYYSTSVGPKIHWVITGYESGQNAHPGHPAWARDIRDDCLAAETAFFHKQNGDYGLYPATVARKKAVAVANDGTAYDPVDIAVGGSRRGEAIRANHQRADLTTLYRVGKKAAGRLLDGRTHDEFPTVEVPA